MFNFKDSNSTSKEDSASNFYSTNNTISKDGRCESILKESSNPLKLSFLNQKQDTKDYLKQQLQQTHNLKPNDNFILNDVSPNNQINSNNENNNKNTQLFDVSLFSDLESHTFLSKSNQNVQRLFANNTNKFANKYDNKYSKSKNVLIDLNDDYDVKMINPNYDQSESEDNSDKLNKQNHGHSHDHGHGHSHAGHGHSHGDHNASNNRQVSVKASNSTGNHCHVATNVQDRNKRVWYKLITVLCLCVLFMVGEIIGGIIAHSISIQTDAAHMAADIAGFFFSIMAIYISKKGKSCLNLLIYLFLSNFNLAFKMFIEPTKRMSFGYFRSEVLGVHTVLKINFFLLRC